MKTFSIALQSELEKRTTHLATCMRITRTDGLVFGFTTYDRLLSIGGVDYESAVSFNPSDIASGNNLDTDNLSAAGLLDSDTLTEDDLRAGRWDYAAYRIFQVDYRFLAYGDKKDRIGHLGEVKVGRIAFVTELLGLMEAYGTSIGEITTPHCRANLGDLRCKVDLTGGSPQAYTVTGIIDAADDDFFTIYDTNLGQETGYFDEGVIIFIDGLAAGLSYEIKTYLLINSPLGGKLVTKTPLAYNVAGSAYSMHRGCRKRLVEDCQGTFNNAVNFRGEPWLRGNDALMQVGRRS